jgi:hypothetical protein
VFINNLREIIMKNVLIALAVLFTVSVASPSVEAGFLSSLKSAGSKILKTAGAVVSNKDVQSAVIKAGKTALTGAAVM